MQPEYPRLSALPFLRIFVFLSSGILIGKFVPQVTSQILISVAGILMGMTLLFRKSIPSTLKKIIPLILLLCTGTLNKQFTIKNSLPSHREQIKESALVLQVKKNSPWASVIAKRKSGEIVRCLVKKNKVDGEPTANSMLLLEGELRPIDGPLIYGDTDWKAINNSKGINRMGFFREGKWKTLKENGKISLKEKLDKKIHQYISDQQLAGISSSLLIGERSGMDNEILREFQIAGSVHLLAVSGLHVGFVLLMLSQLFKIAPSDKIRLLFILIGIWGYAILTGASPSVLRSSLMITILLAGKILKRNGNSINTLLAAGSLILLWNPDQLFDLGFQLSFSAIGGILLFFPITQAILGEHKKRWKKWIQELFLLSLSAQLGTLPLMLLHFHQFPLWFLLTNLVVIPLSAIILYTGALMLVTSFLFPNWASYPAQIHEYLLSLLVQFNHFISKLPYAQLKIPVFETIHALILSLVLLSLWIFLIAPKRKTALLLGIFSIGLSWSLSHRALQLKDTSELKWGSNTLVVRKGSELLIAGSERGIRKVQKNSEKNHYIKSRKTRIISWPSCKGSPFYRSPFQLNR